MLFQDKVKQVRKHLNLSQEGLARELGVSFSTVNRWETGKKEPSALGSKAFYEFCTSKKIVFADSDYDEEIVIGGKSNA